MYICENPQIDSLYTENMQINWWNSVYSPGWWSLVGMWDFVDFSFLGRDVCT